MQVQINSDNHISNSEEFSAELTSSIQRSMQKFSSHITRLEVYLRDENSNKSGADDKKCSIEARLEGLQPLGVSHKGETLRDAFNGAVKKIERVVHDALEKQRS